MGHTESKEVLRHRCEKAAFLAQRKLLEKFVAMARSPARVEMMKRTLQKSVEVASAMTGAEKGSLFLLDDDGTVSDSFLARDEPSPEEKSEIIRSVLEGGLAGWVKRYHRIGLITDTEVDDRWVMLPDQPYTARSALAIPLKRGKEIFGILTLFHSEPDNFSRENADLMQLAGNQMGLALENVRLYQKLDKSHHTLSASKKEAESYSRELDAELEKGHKMQKDFLPADIPEISNWEIKTCFQPAIQVAGDFYDVFRLPGNYLGLVIGDVCDKGVGSALYMALLRSLIRIFSGQTQLCGLSIDQDEAMTDRFVDPRDFCDVDQTQPLRAIPITNNYLLQNHSEMCMFATIFFGVLNPDTGILVYINAGHLAPLIVGSDGVIKHHLGSTGPVVGLMPESEFRMQQVQIDPEDILISYTDGITEATSADGEFFMRQRLEKIVTQNCASAGEMITKIQAAISAYTGNVPQSDDITILAVQRKRVN